MRYIRGFLPIDGKYHAVEVNLETLEWFVDGIKVRTNTVVSK